MAIGDFEPPTQGYTSRYTTTVPKRQPRNFSVGGFQMNNQQIRNDGRVNPTPVGKYSTETLEKEGLVIFFYNSPLKELFTPESLI